MISVLRLAVALARSPAAVGVGHLYAAVLTWEVLFVVSLVRS